MIYTTGTIAGSGSTLTGTGTNFAAAGSLIRNGCTVIVLTNPAQVFQITGVTNATQLAVTPAVNPAIPAGTRYAILLSDSLSVDGLAQDIAETFGMYQRYMSGFADVMTGTGNVTITINGTSVTVPAQKSLVQKGANGAAPVESGGTGSITAAGARGNLGISDKQLNSVDGKTGGTISSPANATGSLGIITNASSYGALNFIYPSTQKTMAYAFCENYGDVVIVTTAATVAGTEKYFAMRQNGNFTTQGNISCVSLTQTSDADKKDDIATINNARDKIRLLRGVTYILKDTGMPSAGVIAQELMDVLPEAIGSVFDDYDQYESVEEPYQDEKLAENGEPITVTETRVVTRLKRARDDSKRSYTVDYAAVTGLVLQTAVELDQALTTIEEKQHNMEAFLQTLGYNPETDYTIAEED
ncbi:hypothetical protein EV102420_48_00010 [Pseudescherichia vulneris NBRC 102420]|uniref:Peptidase S74 domain-containing protein n=1 Tax=Pseudescherichia vulneris NBRC 102420 TaxID=1115515 RepID=A0A090VB09_PSEVU|nr:tail fiber domain-containing protein [Pseudescherichia vulneris]GAL60554.1 hypothetical protein EV102420_48_00010 [Pseudescherichia vulneris NBRC 102420]STQ59763.1 L-shaped tail fiber protein [Pseudescherichia vulneris]